MYSGINSQLDKIVKTDIVSVYRFTILDLQQ